MFFLRFRAKKQSFRFALKFTFVLLLGYSIHSTFYCNATHIFRFQCIGKLKTKRKHFVQQRPTIVARVFLFRQFSAIYATHKQVAGARVKSLIDQDKRLFAIFFERFFFSLQSQNEFIDSLAQVCVSE